MFKVYFITSNLHKFKEAKAILKPYPVKLIWVNKEYPEPQEETLEEIAKTTAKSLAEKLKLPIVVEDTGIYFRAFKNFPGPLAKPVFKELGYEGIFKLLEGKSRKALFKSVVGFCLPGKEPQIFIGQVEGEIAPKIYNLKKKVMGYERIFIPKGFDQTYSKMPRSLKNKISQRAIAFRNFGEFIKKNLKKLENTTTLAINFEKLAHFICPKCFRWWTIGDIESAKNKKEWFCPWCGAKLTE